MLNQVLETYETDLFGAITKISEKDIYGTIDPTEFEFITKTYKKWYFFFYCLFFDTFCIKLFFTRDH